MLIILYVTLYTLPVKFGHIKKYLWIHCKNIVFCLNSNNAISLFFLFSSFQSLLIRNKIQITNSILSGYEEQNDHMMILPCGEEQIVKQWIYRKFDFTWFDF